MRKSSIFLIFLCSICAISYAQTSVNVHGTSNPRVAGMPNGTTAVAGDIAPNQKAGVGCPVSPNDLGPNFVFIGTLNGHQYFKSTESYTWRDANNLAFSLGGHIATITSKEENDFIFNNGIYDPSITPGDWEKGYWLGLNDTLNEGSFVWSTDEPFDYTNWQSGEPNDANGEDFVQILPWNGEWNDYLDPTTINEPTTIRFILEFEPCGYSAISTFTLLNAATDQDIMELRDGDTLNLAALSTKSINIRANTSPAKVGSVVFYLDGPLSYNKVENIAPYTLFGDNIMNYNSSGIPPIGWYTLTATPFSEAKGTGIKGTARMIQFYVIYQEVSSFTLINAETDKEIKTIKNGDVIDLSTLPTHKLNIRALTAPASVGSVVFNLNNKVHVVENFSPYAI